MNDLGLNLATARYAGFRASMGVPVRTSVGAWRRPIDGGPAAYVKALTPYGIFRNPALADATMATKEALYLQRLDDMRSELLQDLHRLTVDHPTRPLVFLCYEDVHKGEVCHRTWAARWFATRLGLVVPEVSAAPKVDVAAEAATLW